MDDGKAFSTDIEVRFRDMDALGHVNHAVFLTYFEESRKQFFREVFHVSDPSGFGFIMARVCCDYLRSIKLGDRIRALMWVGEIGRKSFTLHYRLVDRNDGTARFAEAESVQVCYDYRENRSVPVPAELREKLAPFRTVQA